MASTASDLAWNAGYGHQPFDLFILDNWEEPNPDLTTAGHQEQWNTLVRRYLSLPLVERWPFYKRCSNVSNELPSASPLPSPTPSEVCHIFTPHQTIQERNLNAKFGCGWNIVWLRTCYDPSLSQKYYELEKTVGVRVSDMALESKEHVLDDESLYGFEGTDQEVLNQLLLRIPGLTDAGGILDEYGDGSLLIGGSGNHDPLSPPQANTKIEKAASQIENFIYVVDDEAVEQGIIKVWWYDEFGKIIWDNVVEAKWANLDGVMGASMDGQGFGDWIVGGMRGMRWVQ